MSMYRYFLQIILVFLLSFSGFSVYALDISPQVQYEESDHTVRVSLFVDPGTESVNAYEGNISYDEDSLFLSSTETSGSVVSQWLSFPEKSKGSIGADSILFEGITLGSFSGVIVPNNETKRQGLLFTLVFDGRQEGETIVSFKNLAVYRADGRATKIPLTDKKLKVIVGSDFVKTAVTSVAAKKRTVENTDEGAVYISVESSKDLYSGKPFIVFNNLLTQKTPVKYEVSELPAPDPRTIPDYSWVEAKSPYMLTQTGLSDSAHVRVTYSDGTFSYKTIKTVEKTRSDDEFSYILMIGTLFLLTVLYVVYSLFYKKKTGLL